MPTANEFDPLPLPDYGLDYGEGDRIADRMKSLRAHRQALTSRRRASKGISAIIALVLGVVVALHAPPIFALGFLLGLGLICL
jgi:Flp pilus assembly protein TadB